MMSQNEIARIAADEVQEYIFMHSNDDEKKILLENREILGMPASPIVQQISIRRKAESKLPLFYRTKGIVYPPSINWEQCSSEATGTFKGELISHEIGNDELKIADLTGGYGVDSLFFSKRAEVVDYIEPDPGLLNNARHNHKLLGCGNIQYHQNSAEGFLENCRAKYSLIYLDPSRRDVQSKKVFRLADCQPDIVGLLPQIFEYTEFSLIKTSPLLDIQKGLSELNSVKKVIVVSVNNDCKELLFLMQKGFLGNPLIETYNIDKLGTVKQYFSFNFKEERNSLSDFSEPQTYLYEPNASILKAGAFKMIGKTFSLSKLHVNTHFYTSNNLNEKFPGRIFKVDQLEFDPKHFADKKANVITRNYPLPAEALKKKLKLSDGGDKYIIGFSSSKKKHVVLATRLV